jgi:hypothetical protein
VYDAIYIEKFGKPTVTYVYEYFANDAASAASGKGMPVIRTVPEKIVSEATVMEEIEPAVKAVFANVIEMLTKPLTAEEKSPKRREQENPPRIVFKGNLEDVNRFFYQRGWTDGLPVLPPTEAAVAEMLTGTDLPADHLVTKMEPRMGKATVERIAINAVMAGCLPTYMPVLIAGVQALVDNLGPGKMAASTGSWSPFYFVNGPVRNDLGISCGYGAASPGNIANAAIGRFFGLITKNIRGVRKQIEDMGVLGNPGKYSFIVGENEENSPWEPFHVEYGFKKDDSTITVCFPQSYQQMVPFGTDDKGILATVVGSVVPARMGLFNLILTPNNAQALAKKGWNKKSLKEYIIKNTRIPDDYYSRLGLNMKGPADRTAFMGPGEDSQIFHPTSERPDPVQILVYGGFGSWMGFLQGGPPQIIRKIELPKNWAQLVKKYKNIVPTYVRY